MGKLNFFLHPKSIAIIGASAVEGKVGHAVLRNIIKSEYKGIIYPINPKGGEILGIKCYKSISEVPGPIDVAVICIPARLVNKSAIECGEKGVKGIIVVAAGFKEVGGEGARLESELVDICHKYNIRCVGPNVLGNITTSANMSFSAKTPHKGKVSMLSQSGAMMTAVLDWADSQKIGFANFISIGNKCDVDEVDFIEEIADDPETTILILYLESVTNGEKFRKVVSKATRKKPIVILKSGISPAGKAAASSHTGALAGDDMAFDIAFERCGVIRANTMKELFDLSNLFDKIEIMPKGNRFAILTNAGGPGIIATDAFEKCGLQFAKFNEATVNRLHQYLPSEASVRNPVDVVGDAKPQRFRQALEAIFEEMSPEECAGAVVLVTPQSTTDPIAVAEVLVSVHKQFPDRLMLTTFIGGDTMTEPRCIVEENGITSYQFPEPAIQSLRSLMQYRNYLLQEDADIDASCKVVDVDDSRIDEILNSARGENRNLLQPSETYEICSMLGIECPKTRLIKTVEEIESVCTEVGFPCVMKIVSPDIQHKSDIGGVKLGIISVEQAKESFNQILMNVKKNGPLNARIYGVEIQQMKGEKERSLTLSSSNSLNFAISGEMEEKPSKITEMIIGMTKDQQWGPMLMVGAGGIYANYNKDVAFQMTPGYNKKLALEQLKKTRIYQILEGVRGEERSDINSLVSAMVKVAQLVNDHPAIQEMDINPLVVRSEGEGIAALDVKIIL